MSGDELLDESGPRPHRAGNEQSFHARSSNAAGPVVAILQSNYIPWKGYFDLLGSADVFILYDIVQYTKNDWRNRNRIRTPAGTTWLTIPVSTSGRFGQRIDEVEVSDTRWARKHWHALETSYGRARGFADLSGELRSLYDRAGDERRLSVINELFIRAICRLLGLETSVIRLETGELPEDRVDRLVTICRRFGGRVYLTGPAARGYLDESRFLDAGIDVRWFDYRGYPEYRQAWAPPFIHEVSVVDLLFSEGADARRFLKCSQQNERKRD